MMTFRPLATIGISVLLLGSISAAAHPTHGPSDCIPGTPGEYCLPMETEKPYEVGAKLPEGYGELSEWDRFSLTSPPEGQAYSMVEGDIVLYDQSSMIVLKVVKQLDTSF